MPCKNICLIFALSKIFKKEDFSDRGSDKEVKNSAVIYNLKFFEILNQE